MLVLASVLFAAAAGTADVRLASLQQSLNAALPDDDFITIVAGNDFEASAGTVLFLPREEAVLRLSVLARTGRDEISVMHLPRRGAWLLDGIVRSRDGVESDIRYVKAAVFSEPEVEFWHFHNSLDDSVPSGDGERLQRRLMYSVPSGLDLMQMYGVAELESPAQFRGVVVGTVGVMTYWADDYFVIPPEAPWQVTAALKRQIDEEAMLIKMEAKVATPTSLVSIVEQHRGMFRYRFELVP